MEEKTLDTNDLTPKKIKIEEPEIPQYGFNNFTITSPEEIEKRAKLSSIIIYGKDDGDSHLVYSYIMIAGKEVLKESHFTLKIKQEINTHNEFEVICPSEGFDEQDEIPFRNTREYLGNKLTIGFKQFGKTASLFTGIITNISHKKVDGYPHIVLKGKSPTILMEEGQVCRSFENQTLEEIAKTITQGYPSDILECDLRPLLKDKLLYTVQSESNFAFLQRLGKRYGEWVYHSGEQLVFGSYGGKTIELMEEQDVYEFELSMKILPQKFNYIGYDPNQAQDLSVDSSEVPVTRRLLNHFQQHAMQVSEDIYPNSPQNLYNHSLMENGKAELNSAVKRQKLSRQNVVCVEAKSNNPKVQLGDIVKLKAWVPGNSSFKSGEIPIESYRVTKITHHHEGVDGYYNTFTGIPMDNEVPPYMDEDVVPVGADQSAIVTDNKDPKGMGRLRVQFPWQKATNDQTPWIRANSLYAGADRGIYFMPEIGDEVKISFEGGNAEKPYVSGTVYNGKAKSGYYADDNRFKAIKTDSGHYLEFEELKNITLADAKGNKFHIDSQRDNLNITALNRITLNARDIELNATNNLELNISNAMISNIMTATYTFTPYYKSIVSGQMDMFSSSTLIHSQNKLNIESKDVTAIGSDKILVHSDKEAVMNSKGTAFMHGKAGNLQDNIAKEVPKSETEQIALAVVEFRPSQLPAGSKAYEERYEGQYGFDYFRIDDSPIDNQEAPYFQTLTDSPFETGYYQAGDSKNYQRYQNRREQYEALKREYESLTIAFREEKEVKQGNENEARYYFVPYLSLYSKEYISALPEDPKFGKPSFEAWLSLITEIDEELDGWEFEYNTQLFEHKLQTQLETQKSLKKQHNGNIKITCLKDFDTEQEIRIYACPKGSKEKSEAQRKALRSLAGKIKVLPNSAQHRKKLKILVVNTITDVKDKKIEREYQRGKLTEKPESELHQFFWQAYIELQVEYFPEKKKGEEDSYLDLTRDSWLKAGNEYVSGVGELIDVNSLLLDKFFDHLESYIPEEKKNSLVLFVLGIKKPYNEVSQIAGQTKLVLDTNGNALDFEKRICLYQLATETTLAHETGHALGLFHTFPDSAIPPHKNARYFFFKKKTANLMDYASQRFLCKWQWDILRSRV